MSSPLLEEVKEVQPKVICPMGDIALSCFLSNRKISEAHGKPHRYGNLILIPLYPLAYAISNPDVLEAMKRDLLTVKDNLLRDQDR